MEISILDVVMAVLAGWRITSALNRERIGRFFRRKLAGEHLDSLGMETYPDNFKAALITCFWCLSFWISMFCMFWLIFYPLFLYPFAISTLVIVIEEKVLNG